MGGSLLNADQFPALVKGLAPFLRKNQSILVHGGGKEITNLAEKLAIPTRFVQGRRYTDEKTMEVVEMVLSGKVNPSIVARLNSMGIPALGLSGRDASLVQAKPVRALGLVGIPTKIKTEYLRRILEGKFVPVFSSVAADGNGQALNVNADEMASALAASLKARRLILFTDVPGILDPLGKTIERITPSEGGRLVRDKVISGGMIPKVRSAFSALKAGVKEIWILQGKLPLQNACGTLITSGGSSCSHPFEKMSH